MEHQVSESLVSSAAAGGVGFTVPKGTTTATVAHILKEHTKLKHAIKELMRVETFEDGDIELFDAHIKAGKLDESELEGIFEVYLRMGGFEAMFDELCMSNGIYLRHGVACEPTRRSGAPFSKGNVYEKARKAVEKGLGGSRASILAYVVCLAIDREFLGVPYTGEHEVYYIMNYILQGLDKTHQAEREDRIIISWAKNCKHKFSGALFTITCDSFFARELTHTNSMKPLVYAIILRKSHKLLFSRLNFVMRNKEARRIAVKSLIGGEAMKKYESSMAALLVLSHSSDSAHFEDILDELNDESIMKRFILDTGQPLRSFFTVCQRVDENFMKCLSICIEHLGTIRNDALVRMICQQKFNIDSFDLFKRVVQILTERKIPLPLDKLFVITKYKNRTGDFINWRVEVLHRIAFVGEQCRLDGSVVPFIRRALSWHHPELSFRILFMVENYKIFRKFISKCDPKAPVLGMVTTGLSGLDLSLFYYKVCKLLMRSGMIAETGGASEKEDLRQRLGLDSSPMALAILHKLGRPTKDKPIHKGLYFNRGLLSLSKMHSKFVLGVRLVLFLEYLKDMPLLRMDGPSPVEIFIESGDIKIRGDETIPLIVLGPVRGFTAGELELVMSIVYDNGHMRVEINSQSVDMKIGKVSTIKIDENFYGVVKKLFYAETLEQLPVFFEEPEEGLFSKLMTYATEFIVPVSRLLVYKSRKGVLIDGGNELFLGKGCDFVQMQNLMRHG